MIGTTASRNRVVPRRRGAAQLDLLNSSNTADSTVEAVGLVPRPPASTQINSFAGNRTRNTPYASWNDCPICACGTRDSIAFVASASKSST